MCKHCFEEMCKRTEKIMLFCKLKNNDLSELSRLCSCQRYCSDRDRYIKHKQKENCKEYEKD